MADYMMPNANPDEISRALSRWSDLYFAQQPDPSYRVARGFQDLAKSKGSSDRSRALEMYNIGLLRGVISPTQGGRSQMPLGWQLLSNDESVLTELGYIAYLLGRVSESSDSDVIKAGISALSAIYTIQCYIELKNGIRFSCLTLFEWLKIKFPKSDDVEYDKWQRHLAAAMFCTIKDDVQGEELAESFLNDDPSMEPKLSLIWKSKKITFNSKEFKEVIINNPSVVDVTPVKPALYWCGERGIYSQASRNCKSFLEDFAKEELRSIKLSRNQPSTLFENFFKKDSDHETINIMSLVQELVQIPKLTTSTKKLMIDLREGATDAVKKLYNEDIVSEAIQIHNTLPTGLPYQKVFFGPPGTGKSHTAEEETKSFIIKRTTFHPDADYISFVGSYKPLSDGINIKYEFRPQIFSEIYLEAWLNPEQVYFLIIEEINRGNCAQIFGDLFQSLDRNKNGFSRYAVKADTDFTSWLYKELVKDSSALNRYEHEIRNRKLTGKDWIILPQNFYIWATMNTSDQSLFPMDTAFKRRWQWQYVPINIKDAREVTIDLGNAGKYNWGDFIEVVNKKIYDLLQSEDKQLGNRFVNPIEEPRVISIDEFKSKVLFYLWSEIYKLETESQDSIFYYQPADLNASKERFTFANLYEDDADDRILPSFMQALVKRLPDNVLETTITSDPETDIIAYTDSEGDTITDDTKL